MSFKAEIVADSKNIQGDRITSILITFPRYILAELNTHRMLSKNSASSRAIKFEKMVKAVKENPFIPVKWMKNHTGMQGTEYVSDQKEIDEITACWLGARDNAIKQAEIMNDYWKVTKQMTNRLLEPFMWHKVLITGTEWENFFALRASSHADIHMKMLADHMLVAMNDSFPKLLQPGEWHIPFGDNIDITQFDPAGYVFTSDEALTHWKIKVATARCAQTSYTLIGEDEKEMNYIKLINLHNDLATKGHWSPFEHCNKSMTDEEYELNVRGKLSTIDHSRNPMAGHFDIGIEKYADNSIKGWCGNFRGFIQYRKLFTNENVTVDPRLIRK